MGLAIGLRDDFDGAALRRLSRSTKSANQARRVLALAEIYDGGNRTAAARIGGVGLQIVTRPSTRILSNIKDVLAAVQHLKPA